MAFIRAIIGFILAVALAGFAVMNRQDVALFYSPAHPAIEIPLYLVVLGMMAIGFLVGGMFVWMSGAGVRKMSRQQRKTIKSLEKELTHAKDGQVANLVQPPAEFFPSLPRRKKSAI